MGTRLPEVSTQGRGYLAQRLQQQRRRFTECHSWDWAAERIMTLLRPHSQRVNTILSADIWEKNIQHTMFIIRICKNLYQVQLLFTKCVTITLKLWLWRLSKPVRFTFYKTDGTWKQRQAQPLQRILLRTHSTWTGQGQCKPITSSANCTATQCSPTESEHHTLPEHNSIS